ncbi:serine O-acetyltransferase [Marinobacterium mangrovicola]|uniref:Serine acetyltransferase n=1 Tax=Marinobacterium mangrovicola TaxID=1476959 RepID=A0A4V2PCU8_9GAMM|nr:serine O-acetyltransferase [Marinobacterium mangrovicola]TCK02706.1 serine O-acetyltransferase [Marinobacterium mangrovicola]
MNAGLNTLPVARKSLFALWKEDVGCVFQRDPAARNKLEVLTTYPGVHAVIMHRLAHRLWRANWRYLARLIAYLMRLLTNVDIHPGAQIGDRLFIDHGACVVIGETAIVGHDVTLYHGVTLGGTSWNKGRRHPTLGDRVLVGAGAKVLGPITIASDARVGANSVVVQDVPEGSTVVGIPGRIVSDRPANSGEHGINLNHHLIPDPVGRAIACLLERIDNLEARLETEGRLEADYQASFYANCSPSSEICEKDCAGGQQHFS